MVVICLQTFIASRIMSVRAQTFRKLLIKLTMQTNCLWPHVKCPTECVSWSLIHPDSNDSRY